MLEDLPSIDAVYRVFRYEADQGDSNFATHWAELFLISKPARNPNHRSAGIPLHEYP